MFFKKLEDEKVISKLEELSIKPNLTEDEQRQLENLLKVSKITIDRWSTQKEQRDRIIKNMLKIGEIVLPLSVTWLLFGASLTFETTQCFNSRTAQVVKNLFSLGK